MDIEKNQTPVVFSRAVLRPPASIQGLAILFVILALLLGVVALAIHGVGSLIPSGLSALLLVLTHRVMKQAPSGGTGLSVSSAGIAVGGQMQLARDVLRRAIVVEEKGQSVVVLQSRLFLCLVEVEHPEEGRALVRALGMDPTKVTSDFSFDSLVSARLPISAFWLYLFLPLLSLRLIVRGVVLLLPLLLGGWYLGLLLMAASTKLSIGLDGVLVRWLWRRKLIRFEDLQEIRTDPRAIHLVLRDGTIETLSAYWTAQPWERGWYKQSSGFGSRRAYLDTVVARITEAWQAQGSSEGARLEAWLSQNGRDTHSWVEHLRKLLTSTSVDFRKILLEPEHLWATIEDRKQPPRQRAAAAAALGPSLDEEGRQRLRVASSVVVDPGLRAALDASIRQDEDALIAALEVLEESEGLGQKSQRS